MTPRGLDIEETPVKRRGSDAAVKTLDDRPPRVPAQPLPQLGVIHETGNGCRQRFVFLGGTRRPSYSCVMISPTPPDPFRWLGGREPFPPCTQHRAALLG